MIQINLCRTAKKLFKLIYEKLHNIILDKYSVICAEVHNIILHNVPWPPDCMPAFNTSLPQPPVHLQLHLFTGWPRFQK